MKYSPSFDGQPRAEFRLCVRLTKKEVEALRRYLQKKQGRGLDIDVRRFVTESGSCVASEDLADFIERLKEDWQ